MLCSAPSPPRRGLFPAAHFPSPFPIFCHHHSARDPSFIYKKYPRLREAINRRSSVYNEQLELVEQLEDAGEITVIRPQKPIVVDRIERDISKLTDLYEEGYACAAAFSFSSDNIK